MAGMEGRTLVLNGSGGRDDVDDTDSEMGVGQAWRSREHKGLGVFLEGLWSKLAQLCLLSMKSPWKQPRTTKPCLFLGCKTRVNWQVRAFPAPCGTFPGNPCMSAANARRCIHAHPSPSTYVPLRVIPCVHVSQQFAQVFLFFLEIPIPVFPFLRGHYRRLEGSS